MRRKRMNVFSLAFLDVMSCGFGAIILFFMIINADTEKRKEYAAQELLAQVDKMREDVKQGREYLVELKNSIKDSDQALDAVKIQAQQVQQSLIEKRRELSLLRKDTLAESEHVNQLKADLKSLEEANKRLQGGATSTQKEGDQLVYFAGEGRRQYITGLQINGSRLVILVDSSASMLADRIVNVIRTRILSDKDKIRARKWQQVVATVQWISSQIPQDSQFQLITYNENVRSNEQAGEGQWLDGSNPQHLRLAIDQIVTTVPEGGTSLYHAFAAIDQLKLKPDQIFLLTDSLPTQGKSKPKRSKVDAPQRVNYFNEAVRILPSNIPVNVILFPMEGDPDAASAYWLLAAKSNGAFFSPAADWP